MLSLDNINRKFINTKKSSDAYANTIAQKSSNFFCSCWFDKCTGYQTVQQMQHLCIGLVVIYVLWLPVKNNVMDSKTGTLGRPPPTRNTELFLTGVGKRPRCGEQIAFLAAD